MSEKIKTNAMRILDKAKTEYEIKTYDYDENDLSGMSAAEKMGSDPNALFKTLVLRGEKTGILVCVIPVNKEINLKALARAAKDKHVEMIHLKELLGLTGYVRGGCSPIGMKKLYPTFIEKSCLNYEKIGVSAGKRGVQILVNPNALINTVNARLFDNN